MFNLKIISCLVIGVLLSCTTPKSHSGFEKKITKSMVFSNSKKIILETYLDLEGKIIKQKNESFTRKNFYNKQGNLDKYVIENGDDIELWSKVLYDTQDNEIGEVPINDSTEIISRQDQHRKKFYDTNNNLKKIQISDKSEEHYIYNDLDEIIFSFKLLDRDTIYKTNYYYKNSKKIIENHSFKIKINSDKYSDLFFTKKITYSYNNDNLLDTMKVESGHIDNIGTYDLNNHTIIYEYDSSNRLKKEKVFRNFNNSLVFENHYDYDDVKK